MSPQKHQISSRGNPLIVQVPGGLGNLIRWLAERLKEDTGTPIDALLYSFKVRLEEEVVGIKWNDGGCSIATRAGSTFHCQHAILTLPLGVLQVGISSITHSVVFTNYHNTRQTTKSCFNQIWGEKYWRHWATLVLAVSAKSFSDGKLLGGKKEKDQSGSPDQGVFRPFMRTCSLMYVSESDVLFL